jgi:D-ribose pyranose/furanose isomerase RbsD
MKLVAYINQDASTYGQLSALINRMGAEQILIVKDKSTPMPFSSPICKAIDVDSSKDLLSFKDEIQNALKPHLKEDFEVALSIASGNGKEHMALISALLNLPVGIKLTAFTKQGVEFIS